MALLMAFQPALAVSAQTEEQSVTEGDGYTIRSNVDGSKTVTFHAKLEGEAAVPGKQKARMRKEAPQPEEQTEDDGAQLALEFFREGTSMLLDITAPIIPFEGFGEIKLYSTRKELSELLSLPDIEPITIYKEWIRYDIQNSVMLFFHLGNDKLFKITTMDNYKGKVFEKIGVGMTEEEMLKVEPSFVYDDFEEVWESDKGVLVETDGETNKIRWISVYVSELFTDDFDSCEW